MTRLVARLALAALLPGAAAAQEALSPQDFLNMVEGRTIAFAAAADGTPLGDEQFLGEGRSLLRLPDGSCHEGEVSVRGPAICFAYPELSAETECFWMMRDEGRLLARSAALISGRLLEVGPITDAPLACGLLAALPAPMDPA